MAAIVKTIPRTQLAQLPTPLQEMPRLQQALGGPRLFVKRDDQTGLATGGNKTRKLEYLMADALAQEADIVVTAGAVQSNHCRQTAAAAARLGLDCELVLGGEPADPPNGNLLLDHLLGAELHFTAGHRRAERLAERVETLRAAGRRPYLIPVGGSNRIGAVAYAVAMQEVAEQLAAREIEIDHILFPSSSGGTQAGVVVGARLAGFTGRITGIKVDAEKDPERSYTTRLATLANETAQLLEIDGTFAEERFTVDERYLGGGYGVVGDLEREAIRLVARTEGLLLDPVYTGRAMGGMLDMIRNGRILPEETVLFWHTGGTPALFAYTGELF